MLKLIWLVVELILQVKKNYFAGGPSVHKNEEIMEQKPPHFQKALDVSFPLVYHGYLRKFFQSEKKAFAFA